MSYLSSMDVTVKAEALFKDAPATPALRSGRADRGRYSCRHKYSWRCLYNDSGQQGGENGKPYAPKCLEGLRKFLGTR